MSILNSVVDFTKHASYALQQGIKEDINDWTGGPDNKVSHGAGAGYNAIKGGIGAYKAETTGLHIAEKTAVHIAEKVVEKAAVKGVVGFVAGPLAWATDIYHIGHGAYVGWQSYGH